MAIFKIDSSNYKSLKRKFLTIDEDFIIDNKINPGDEILIEKITDLTCTLLINDVDLTTNKTTVHTCTFMDFYVGNTKFNELIIWSLIIGENPQEGILPHLVVFDEAVAQRLWVYHSTFNQGFLIRNSCDFKDFRINDSSIFCTLAFTNSNCEGFEIESSKATYVTIRDTPSIPGGPTLPSNLKTINIFRTEISGGVEINEVPFQTLHFHKIRLKNSEKLSNYQNKIYIASKEEQNLINSIKITESEIEPLFIFSVDELTEFIGSKNQFGEFRVNFSSIDKFVITESVFAGYAYWGMPNHMKVIQQYQLTNCDFQGEYNFSNVIIENSIRVHGSKFSKYPSFFSNIIFGPNCKYDFNYTKFSNLIFENIPFQPVLFKDFDITNAEFRNCEWEETNGFFYTRNVVSDEKTDKRDVPYLIKLKDIYAKLKTNYYNNSDYINSGRFLISEHEIKREIAKSNKSWLEYLALTMHKNISSYGESFTQPISLMIISWLIMSVVYMFTGFTSDDKIVQFELVFDCGNLANTFTGFIKSSILSLKNLVPFPISPNFFLFSSKQQSFTQTLELIQKILNLVLFASFTTALLKHINK
jgi:hypothetical protein